MSEEKQAKELKDVPWYRSARTVLALVTAWGCVFFYLLRFDITMALVCMVSNDETSPGVSSSANESSFTDLYYVNTSAISSMKQVDSSVEQCGNLEKKAQRQSEFRWSKKLRGFILSSFFYGYIFTQVPGGWLANRFGGKHVFAGGMFISIVATMFVPTAARTSPLLLIVVRVIMGVAQGVCFPATHHLFGMWIPPNERSKVMSFCYAGTMLGTIFAMFVSGQLCDLQEGSGWQLIFYIYGGISFVWLIFWNFLVYDTPLTHPRIDPVERDYIVSTIGPSVYGNSAKAEIFNSSRAKIPWSSIAKSKPMWAIIISHFCNNWANYTILNCIPMYMNEVLKFNIKENGMVSAVPHMLGYIAALGSGQLADFLIGKKILSTTKTRKLFQSLSTSIPAACLISMGFTDCDKRTIAIVLLCVSIAVNNFSKSGFMVNHIDISSRHAGILFEISNTVATIPGIVSPTVVTSLTPDHTKEQWQIVFFICGALYIFSGVVYIILGDGNPQKWSTNKEIKTPTATMTKL